MLTTIEFVIWRLDIIKDIAESLVEVTYGRTDCDKIFICKINGYCINYQDEFCNKISLFGNNACAWSF